MTATAGPGARDLVGVVQRFGLFSAAAVVTRYTEVVDRALSGDWLIPDADPPVDGAGAATRAALGVVDALAALLRRTGATSTALVLPAAGPGSESEASLWVHNGTASPVRAVQLRVTALTSSRGASIPTGRLALSPERVAVLPARAALEVRVTVAVPAGQPAGVYHGLVLASADPAEPLAVRLEVR